MKLCFKILVLSLSFGMMFANNVVFAGGLSSTLVEARLTDIQPGKSYSINEKLGRPLVVTNTTESITVDIKIEGEKPVGYNLIPGYEVIPDLSWVRIAKDYFEGVKPGEKIETDIIIQVPDKPEYYGKKYQLYIYSHTVGAGAFRIGLMGRILIDTTK